MDEKSLMIRLCGLREKDDAIDVVVDSLTQQLRKGNPIWFERLWRDDIDGCKEKSADEEVNVENVNEVPQEIENTIINQFTELKDAMIAGFVEMGERVNDMNARLVDTNARLVCVEEMVKVLSNIIPIPRSQGAEKEKEGEEDGAENEGTEKEKGGEEEDKDVEEEGAEKDEEKQDNENEDEYTVGAEKEKER